MGTTTVSEAIAGYLPHLNQEQQEKVLDFVVSLAEPPLPEGLDEAELLRRLDDLKSGRVKGYTWEEVKQRARHQVAQRNNV